MRKESTKVEPLCHLQVAELSSMWQKHLRRSGSESGQVREKAQFTKKVQINNNIKYLWKKGGETRVQQLASEEGGEASPGAAAAVVEAPR